MVEDHIAGTLDLAPVQAWLGLDTGFVYRDRGNATRRYTVMPNGDATDEYAKARTFAEALVKAYPRNREMRIMLLARPQELDDELWRKIYAVMKLGGPVKRWDLIREVARLTHPDRKVAERAAITLYQKWDRIPFRDSQKAE